MMRHGSRLAALLLAASLVGAACAGTPDAAQTPPPSRMIGAFTDDYGSSYVIRRDEWRHGAAARYHIVKWAPAAGYLIARNDASNPSDGGLYSRIDWVILDDMHPYEWAFCMSAYDAATAAEAENTRVAQPGDPRTGCNGHPYTRMKRKE